MPVAAVPGVTPAKAKAKKRKEKKKKKAKRNEQSKCDKEAAEAAKLLTNAIPGVVAKPAGWKELYKNGKDCKLRAAGTCKFWHPGAAPGKGGAG